MNEAEDVLVVCSCLRPVLVRAPVAPHWTVVARVPCSCGKIVTYRFAPRGWSRWSLLEIY